MKEDKYVSAALVLAILAATVAFGGALAYHEVDSLHRAWNREYDRLFGETKFAGTITDAKCSHSTTQETHGDEGASNCNWTVNGKEVRWFSDYKGKHEGLTLAYPPEDSDTSANSDTSLIVSSPSGGLSVDDLRKSLLPKNPDIGKKVEVFGGRNGDENTIDLNDSKYYIKVISK